MVVAAVLVLIPLLGAFASLMWFTIGCLQDMVGDKVDEQLTCPCRPPTLIPEYPNRMTWRCGQCGMRWRIHVDMSMPRHSYRWWVPQ